MTTSYNTGFQSILTITNTPVNDNTLQNLLVIDNNNVVKYRTISSLLPLSDIYGLYYPLSTPNLSGNTAMFVINNSYASASTSSGVGLSGTSLNSLQIMRGLNIIGSIISLSDASVPTATVTYPSYCWIAVYRNDYTNRVVLGFLEFAITTPSGGRGLGTNNTFNNTSGLLGTGSGTTDGIYSVNRILKASPTTGTFTVATISVAPGWSIGMELIDPVASGLNAVATVSTTAGTLSYQWGRAYANAITGFKNVSLTINVQ